MYNTFGQSSAHKLFGHHIHYTLPAVSTREAVEILYNHHARTTQEIRIGSVVALQNNEMNCWGICHQIRTTQDAFHEDSEWLDPSQQLKILVTTHSDVNPPTLWQTPTISHCSTTSTSFLWPPEATTSHRGNELFQLPSQALQQPESSN